MKKPIEKRDKWVNTRFNQTEYEALIKLFKKSMCRELADYMRKSVLNKPISVRYRNQSIDDFLADMVALRKDLNAIGNNFNQSVHRLHTLHSMPEIQSWVMLNEQDKTALFRAIETINNRVNQLYSLWSHE